MSEWIKNHHYLAMRWCYAWTYGQGSRRWTYATHVNADIIHAAIATVLVIPLINLIGKAVYAPQFQLNPLLSLAVLAGAYAITVILAVHVHGRERLRADLLHMPDDELARSGRKSVILMVAALVLMVASSILARIVFRG